MFLVWPDGGPASPAPCADAGPLRQMGIAAFIVYLLCPRVPKGVTGNGLRGDSRPQEEEPRRHGWPGEGAGKIDVACRGVKRRGHGETLHRRGQPGQRRDTMQRPPEQAGTKSQGRCLGSKGRPLHVRDYHRQRRYIDGHRGHEGVPGQQGSHRRLDRDGDLRREHGRPDGRGRL